MKTCGTCKRELDDSEFYLYKKKNKNGTVRIEGGHRCKKCTNIYQKKWREAHKKEKPERWIRGNDDCELCLYNIEGRGCNQIKCIFL